MRTPIEDRAGTTPSGVLDSTSLCRTATRTQTETTKTGPTKAAAARPVRVSRKVSAPAIVAQPVVETVESLQLELEMLRVALGIEPEPLDT